MNKKAVAYMQELLETRERITPDELIELAKDKSCPLHGLFQWDIKKAAIEHWRWQARRIIAAVPLKIVTEKTTISTVAYVRDPDSDSKDQGYVRVTDARSEEDRARSIIVAEFQRVRSILDRAKSLAKALSMEVEINDLLVDVQSLSAKIERTGAQQLDS